MIKVNCTTMLHEVDGIPPQDSFGTFSMESHHSRSDWIKVTIDGVTYTVAGNDLMTAIHNAMNTNARYVTTASG